MTNDHAQSPPLDKVTKNAVTISIAGAIVGTIWAIATGELTIAQGAASGFIGGLIGGTARGLIMSLPRLQK